MLKNTEMEEQVNVTHQSKKRRKQLHHLVEFDINAILMKLCYFFVQGEQGAITPYLTVFLTSTGLDLREASLISGLQFVPSLISTQIFAYIADLTGRKSLVFALVTFIATIVIFPMPWFATLSNIPTSPLNVTKNNTLDVEPSMLYHSNLFYVMLVSVIIGFSFSNPLNGFVDSFVMNVIKSAPNKYDYGKQRSFGVLGFGLLNLIASVVSEMNITSTLPQYFGMFIIFLPAMLMLIPTGVMLEQRGLKGSSENTVSDREENSSQNILPKLFKLFLDMSNFMFLMSFLVAGICNTAIIGFLFKLMADELNATKTQMGISMLVASLTDIVLLVASSKILSYLRDPINGVIISILSSATRFLLIAVLKDPYYIVLTQVLNAPTFSLVWVSGVAHAKTFCPPEITVSLFSLLNNIFFNVGGLVGYWGGGAIYSAYGPKTFFLSMTYFTGGWFLIMVAYFKISKRIRSVCSKAHFQDDNTKLNVATSVATINSTVSVV